jgi:hypothetical protein
VTALIFVAVMSSRFATTQPVSVIADQSGLRVVIAGLRTYVTWKGSCTPRMSPSQSVTTFQVALAHITT